MALEKLGVSELAFPAGAPSRLAELRAHTGLKLPDCCVLLDAQDRSGRVASFDRDLCRSARGMGIPVAG